MKRDRVMRRLKRIVARFPDYVAEGTDVIVREQLESILEMEEGMVDLRTHDRWIELLVKYNFLSRKKKNVFHIVDQSKKAIESFETAEVTVETKEG